MVLGDCLLNVLTVRTCMLLTPGNQMRKGEILEQSLPFGELYTPEPYGCI